MRIDKLEVKRSGGLFRACCFLRFSHGSEEFDFAQIRNCSVLVNWCSILLNCFNFADYLMLFACVFGLLELFDLFFHFF